MLSATLRAVPAEQEVVVTMKESSSVAEAVEDGGRFHFLVWKKGALFET